MTAGTGVIVVDASSRTSAVKITGNALDNSILGGSAKDTLYGDEGNDFLSGGYGNDTLYGDNGDSGNDSLSGGYGNDYLSGGKGYDNFLYEEGDGNDVIYGFDKYDMLLITGAFSTTYDKTNKEIYFKVGDTDNAITLKNFTAKSFNVNGFNYKISGSQLVRK